MAASRHSLPPNSYECMLNYLTTSFMFRRFKVSFKSRTRKRNPYKITQHNSRRHLRHFQLPYLTLQSMSAPLSSFFSSHYVSVVGNLVLIQDNAAGSRLRTRRSVTSNSRWNDSAASTLAIMPWITTTTTTTATSFTLLDARFIASSGGSQYHSTDPAMDHSTTSSRRSCLLEDDQDDDAHSLIAMITQDQQSSMYTMPSQPTRQVSLADSTTAGLFLLDEMSSTSIPAQPKRQPSAAMDHFCYSNEDKTKESNK